MHILAVQVFHTKPQFSTYFRQRGNEQLATTHQQ